MHRYVVELPFPGAGELRREELSAIARRAHRFTREIGPRIQWLQTYFSADRVFVLYLADDSAVVREHVELLGLSIGAVAEVTAVIDPTTHETTI